MSNLTDIETEHALIGALLDDPKAFYELPQRFSASDFSDPTCALIFSAICQIATEQVELSPLILKGRLHGAPKVGEMAPLDYLALIFRSYEDLRARGLVRERGGAAGLAFIVRDMAVRRAMARHMVRGCAQLEDLKVPASDVFMEVMEKLAHSETRCLTPRAADEILKDCVSNATKIAEEGGVRGVRAKLAAWNEVVGPMVGGDLIVVGGATSMGKTALVQQIAREVAAEGHVLVFSLEMTAGQWVERYLSQKTNIPTERIEMGPLSQQDLESLKRAAAGMELLQLSVIDTPRLTPRAMLIDAKRHMSMIGKPLGLVVIDHLQFIEHPDPRREGPSKIADITRDLKAMAKELGVPVILVSHLNRDLSHRNGKRPQLSDLFGSSAIEKDADCVLFVHRENYWIAREGPKVPDDPLDFAEAEANRQVWEAALERTKNEADLILAKRRRGKGAAWKKVTFTPEITLFSDPFMRPVEPQAEPEPWYAEDLEWVN